MFLKEKSAAEKRQQLLSQSESELIEARLGLEQYQSLVKLLEGRIDRLRAEIDLDRANAPVSEPPPESASVRSFSNLWKTEVRDAQ